MRGNVARSSSAALRMLSSDVRSSCCTVTTAFGLAALIRVDGIVALVEIAHRQHRVRTLVGEHGGGSVTDAGVGAGDYGDPAGLIGHVGRGPFGAHATQHTQRPAVLRRRLVSFCGQASGRGDRRHADRCRRGVVGAAGGRDAMAGGAGGGRVRRMNRSVTNPRVMRTAGTAATQTSVIRARRPQIGPDLRNARRHCRYPDGDADRSAVWRPSRLATQRAGRRFCHRGHAGRAGQRRPADHRRDSRCGGPDPGADDANAAVVRRQPVSASRNYHEYGRPRQSAEPEGAAGVGDRRRDSVAHAGGRPGGVVRRSIGGCGGCTPRRRGSRSSASWCSS